MTNNNDQSTLDADMDIANIIDKWTASQPVFYSSPRASPKICLTPQRTSSPKVCFSPSPPNSNASSRSSSPIPPNIALRMEAFEKSLLAGTNPVVDAASTSAYLVALALQATEEEAKEFAECANTASTYNNYSCYIRLGILPFVDSEVTGDDPVADEAAKAAFYTACVKGVTREAAAEEAQLSYIAMAKTRKWRRKYGRNLLNSK